MKSQFHLQLPGVFFEVRCEAGIEIVESRPLYREFVSGSGEGGFVVPVNIRVGTPRLDEAWPVVFESGDTWSLFRDGEDLVAAFPSPTQPGAFWWMARLTSRDPSVDLECDPEIIRQTDSVTQIVNPLHYPLDQILTMMILSIRGGCIVHAAGVHRGGNGLACIGRSGAGKSTLMRLLERRTDLGRLSDDRLILVRGKPATVSGTPWAGEGMVAANETAQLAALVFLHQGDDHELRAIEPREAAAQLLPTTSIPWFDEPSMTGCMATLDHLVRNIPSYNLVFRLDDGVSDLIDHLI